MNNLSTHLIFSHFLDHLSMAHRRENSLTTDSERVTQLLNGFFNLS